MAEQRVQRRLAAILVADVVGYSRLMQDDEAGTLARLKSLRSEHFDPCTERFGGRIFKNTGDGAMAEFGSAVDAVQCAVEVQRALASQNAGAAEGQTISLRIGISLGDVIVEGEDLFGNGVNVAARMESLADPGGVCVSGNVHEHVGNALPVSFDDLGEQWVKNIDRPIRCYRVRFDGEEAGSSPSATAAIMSRPAVAVLPFANMSGDPEQEYFVDGLTEDIITGLAQWRSFPVIARNSTFTYKGRAVKMQDVARELDARYVVEGSVRKGGDRVRVTIQLIDARTGHHVWAERYDRDMIDIFDLQDEITRQVVATLVPELERAEHGRLATKPTESLDAWDSYLRGVALIHELRPEGIAEARELFERAIALDPSYAKAHAMLALTYHRELWLYIAEDREESARRQMEAAKKAVALDDDDAMSHWSLGIANYWPPLGDANVALREAQRASALNPANIDVVFSCGTALCNAGRASEAVPHLEAALRLSPRDPRRVLFLSNLAFAYLMSRRADDSQRIAREAREVGVSRGLPDQLSVWIHTVLISALGHLGHEEEARAVVDAVGEEAVAEGATTLQSGLFYNAITAADRAYLYEGLRAAGVPV